MGPRAWSQDHSTPGRRRMGRPPRCGDPWAKDGGETGPFGLGPMVALEAGPGMLPFPIRRGTPALPICHPLGDRSRNVGSLPLGAFPKCHISINSRGDISGMGFLKNGVTFREWHGERATLRKRDRLRKGRIRALREYMEGQVEPLEQTLRRVLLEVLPGERSQAGTKKAPKKRSSRKAAPARLGRADAARVPGRCARVPSFRRSAADPRRDRSGRGEREDPRGAPSARARATPGPARPLEADRPDPEPAPA
jgi:hypothetical protein